MGRVVLESVSKVFGRDVVAVNDVSLEIEDGEFMVLVGPSGCGKSTILRMLAGLEQVTAGEIWINDELVTDLPPKQRDVAMVFQNYAIYPHMTVAQNIGFGLKLRHTNKQRVKERVTEVAQLLGLGELMHRRPGELSGGQRQRVAIGRAIVRDPKAYLMDEPLSNLDAKLRVQMRAELARLHQALRTTTVFVTHDQVEAMTLGDRVAVLKDGVLQQVDAPQTLFNKPANLFVAAFIGSPPMNLVDAHVGEDSLTFADFSVPIPRTADLSAYRGRGIVLGIRPSDFEDADVWPSTDRPVIEVTADVTEELGTQVHVMFNVAAAPIMTEAIQAASEEPEDASMIPIVAEEGSSIFTAEIDPRTSVRPGARMRLSLDPDRFHFFDPETGEAIDVSARVSAA